MGDFFNFFWPSQNISTLTWFCEVCTNCIVYLYCPYFVNTFNRSTDCFSERNSSICNHWRILQEFSSHQFPENLICIPYKRFAQHWMWWNNIFVVFVLLRVCIFKRYSFIFHTYFRSMEILINISQKHRNILRRKGMHYQENSKECLPLVPLVDMYQTF